MKPYNYNLKEFPLNENGRDFVVGDIHGYFSRLQSQLDLLGFNPEVDRVFSCGDLIDRGPESHKVLEWIDKPWFHPIKGNHEAMVYEYHNNIDWFKSYRLHGGEWFIKLLGNRQDEFVNRLMELPNIIEIETVNGKVGLVHADVPTNDWNLFKSMYKKFSENSLWSFDGYNKLAIGAGTPVIKNIDFVIHGHVSVNEIKNPQNGNRYYIDTGAMTKQIGIIEINSPLGILALHPI